MKLDKNPTSLSSKHKKTLIFLVENMKKNVSLKITKYIKRPQNNLIDCRLALCDEKQYKKTMDIR